MSDTPQKQCARCKEWKDATNFYFGADKYTRDGFTSACKQCLSEARKNPKIKPVIPDGHKLCSDCKKSFPATTEYFYKSTKQGLAQRCTVCDKLQCRAYYQAHKERLNRSSREYHASHREAIKERNRIYAQKHVEQVRKNQRTYRQAHPEKLQALCQKHRAIRKRVEGKYTAAQIQELLKRQKYRCYYAACGHAKFEKVGEKYIYHVDHTFPLGRVTETDIPANHIDYLVLACPSCNHRKNDKFPWEWPEGGRLL